MNIQAESRRSFRMVSGVYEFPVILNGLVIRPKMVTHVVQTGEGRKESWEEGDTMGTCMGSAN